MNRARVTLAMVTALLAALAGCAGDTATRPLASGQADPLVVSHEGVADIRFGDSRAELADEHGLTQGTGDCAPVLPDHPNVSPVFDQGQLVLLWADPPLHTPEGIAVGTDLATVRATHPEAESLSAPQETYRFDGLLATEHDRAYLFLHDHSQVQKVIIGFAEHARLLFEEGFGTC